MTAHAAIEEVIVTAQKRAENIQDVPVAITAFTANQLDASGVNASRDLTLVTPSLNFTASSVVSQAVVRGVGTRNVTPGDESVVPIYIDGVYQPEMLAGLFDLNNIERIEVLKGPQGTLFGRNATGGAISVITKKPSAETSGKISASYGSFNEWRVSGYATTGITEQVAADLALVYLDDDGYVDDLVNGGDIGARSSQSARSKILIAPTDTSEITWGLNYSEGSSDTNLSGQPLDGNTRGVGASPMATKPREAALSFTPSLDQIQYGTDLNATFDFDDVTFASVSGWQYNDSHIISDSDVTPIRLTALDYKQDLRAFSQEFRLLSRDSGPLKWITGVYYYNSSSGDHPLRVLSTSGSGVTSVATTRSRVFTDAVAAFGEATYEITDALSGTAGIRYSYEKKEFSFGNSAGVAFDVDQDWDAWTPRYSLQYRLSDETNVYGSYSKGFKSGVYNATAAQQAPVDQETLNAWELGIKSDIGGWLRANASTFHYSYDNIQVSSRDSAGGQQLQNAAKATIYGADGDLIAEVTDALNIRAGVSWVHGRYDDFENAQVFTPNPNAAVGGNVAVFRDVSGNEIVRTPEYSGNLGFDYSFALPSGRLTFAANAYWSSHSYWEPLNRVKQDAYTIVNAKLSWLSPDESLRLSLWGENLTDETYLQTAVISTTADNVTYRKPLTAGVSADYYWR